MMTRKEAERQLEYVRGLRIRLPGDRVLQNLAWKAAVLLGWPGTFDAGYVALTQLHADALSVAPFASAEHAGSAVMRDRRMIRGGSNVQVCLVMTLDACQRLIKPQ
jgi:hypothetical protein